jgi:hypothetical protein
MFEAAELIPPVGIERQSLCLNTYPIVRYVQAGMSIVELVGYFSHGLTEKNHRRVNRCRFL